MNDEDELYNYYFSDDLISRFSHRFGMDRVINDFIALAKDKNKKETNKVACEKLGQYLLELSTSLARAEKDSMDRTGEIMYQVADKTGIRFPSVPQRLLELGFMSTRPLDKLTVIETNPKALVLRIPSCTAYNEIKQKLGEEKAGDLPCRHACLLNSITLFEQLGIAAEFRNTAKANEKGYCEFAFTTES
jgi:hypothetical protein